MTIQPQSAMETSDRMTKGAPNDNSLAYDTLQMAARMAPALSWCKQWRKDHPPRQRHEIPLTRSEIGRNYRARKKKARGTFTDSQFKALCVMFGNKCLCCGSFDKKLFADHVIPLSRRGSNSINNIQPLCWHCNSVKRDNYADYRTVKINASFLRVLRATRSQLLSTILPSSNH